MRIALLGQQAFGKSVLEAFLERGDEVVGVFCAPEEPSARPDPLLVAAQVLGLKVFQLSSLKSPDAEAALREIDADLGVMAYVLQFAPQRLLDIPKHGTIEYHPSLLPKHRGPSSINWPIIKGEVETGLTIFRPTEGFDEGPLILQKTVAISPDDTLGSLYFNRLFPLGVAAVLEAADLIIAGEHTETPQDEAEASYESWCRDDEARIDWHSHVDLIHNLVRGCDPSPGAWTFFNGTKIRIFGAKKHPTQRFRDVVGQPGEVVLLGDESVHVATIGGVLEFLKVGVDKEPKASAATFAKEFGLSVGTRLGDAPNNA